ncbi:putative iron-regulated protein [Agrobacterium tumefaciens]|uniref:Iron-regulated protein n=1 Tax=Agrobacterium radiobacter TaxID=362 RepID=A0ABR6JG08_AGRRD|nr:ChaN family lipoprotein [Agrobacterium radiobacter]MBB4321513.1 putative iron-regulated protein [Agrobacterium radiobacter]MBB4325536.1 putative iron-regulated protein [Agrobacterium radiobacter]MBB4338553.1 putative iron-regulated protein [Agrobacterium radiobacter]MBB4493441.1 putative iron-regulated protein [Agrobacterium radiobacter]MBB4498712.1 putative iron-regulated protein [Agrobacterium radiobacter]
MSSSSPISFADLAGRISKVDYVLFGERHGVREQAVASSCVLSAMAKDDRPVTVVMEMLSRDDDAAIALYRKNHPETPAGLGVELKWWTRGWPAFDNWLPLVERTFSLRIPLHGGDLAEKDGRTGELTPGEKKAIRKRLGAAETAVRESWTKAMMAAHCGLIPDRQAAMNADHQIRRDLSMADAAEQAGMLKHGVLLQVGRGHGRKDRSLYQALARADASVLTVGAFAEGENITDEERRLYDYLWIVGKAELADPCRLTGLTSKTGESISR